MGRYLALMGSGENSPIMVTPHQKIIKGTGTNLNPINLNTPYSFQENKEELSAKIEKYFEVNVVTKINTSENHLDDINKANWVFAGPGSPTYNLKQWKQRNIDTALIELLKRGSLVLASAAAMSIGNKVMPVYEMYRVGEDPHWVDGVGILESALGFKAVVIAHYNNTQGGTHDTRFCFVGERRMKVLENQLDPDIAILGIDEHTGISFNLDNGKAEVFGKGVITYKKGGLEKTFANKAVFDTKEFTL